MGDYLLSSSLLQAALTGSVGIVEIISRLGGTLSEGEIYQLTNIKNEAVSEEAYFRIISHKTAALFRACAELGALAAGGTKEYVERASQLGEIIGLCFQIRDDIFDYFPASEVGKPTGNDLAEGKITLPAIYAINHTDREDVHLWAAHVKSGEATDLEIADLVAYTKQSGGIEYAEQRMKDLHNQAVSLLSSWKNVEVKAALQAYIDFVVERTK